MTAWGGGAAAATPLGHLCLTYHHGMELQFSCSYSRTIHHCSPFILMWQMPHSPYCKNWNINDWFYSCMYWGIFSMSFWDNKGLQTELLLLILRVSLTLAFSGWKPLTLTSNKKYASHYIALHIKCSLLTRAVDALWRELSIVVVNKTAAFRNNIEKYKNTNQELILAIHIMFI